MSECIFCKDLPKILNNELAYAIYDIKPDSKGHMLIITKRHIEQIFDANEKEIAAIFDLIKQGRDLQAKEHGAKDFNIKVNCGAKAGQIVMHAHVHLVPRY